MTYRFASTSLVVLALCLASCDRSAPKAANAPEPEHVAETTMVETPEASESEGAHYKSKEGNAYYYEGEDGQLTGVVDLGAITTTGDPNGNIKVGDRVIALDGGVFAAVTPGSQIVRVLRRRGMGSAFDQEATLPLDGTSIAAVALRDALAGHISPPPSPVTPTGPAPTVFSAPSFDCRKAASAVEKMICASPELATKDVELTRLYSDWVAKIQSGAMVDDLAEVKSDQRTWVAERNKCTDVACLVKLYDQRIADLPGSGA